MDKKTNQQSSREGSILAVIMILLIALSMLVLSLFHLGYHSARETEYELQKAKAFWLAEAGRQWSIADLYEGEDGTSTPLPLSADADGTFEIIEDPSDPNKRISIGVVGSGSRAVTNAVRVNMAFVAPQFEHVVFGGNNQNGDWNLQLRGTGSALPSSSGSGGIDSLLGDVTIYGNFQMYEDSLVGTPNINTYGLQGDVSASGEIPNTANISGTAYPGIPREEAPDLSLMNYAQNNDYDVAAEFEKYGITSGRLPSNHPLYNVVEKNPSDCSDENDTTTGDDYYFEPRYIGSSGSSTTGVTPLTLGDDKTYYVDGHVWFHNKSTYGFEVDGTAVIVSSRDIHVSDNLAYKDSGEDGDLLALVALGQYDSLDNYTLDGNIYFGDPEYGTLYTCDAFMFANHDFYYNTSANSGEQEIPESGFKVYGNFMALNQIVILRDWYQETKYVNKYTGNEVEKIGSKWYEIESGNKVSSRYVKTIETDPRAVEFDSVDEVWRDAEDPSITYSADDIEHYAMSVEYDERIRSAGTRLSGLPRGNGNIFNGVDYWEEISVAELNDLL